MFSKFSNCNRLILRIFETLLVAATRRTNLVILQRRNHPLSVKLSDVYMFFSVFSGFRKFEGDMMLDARQIQRAERGLDPTYSDGARGLKRSSQWPGGIVPYTIHESASR